MKLTGRQKSDRSSARYAGFTVRQLIKNAVDCHNEANQWLQLETLASVNNTNSTTWRKRADEWEADAVRAARSAWRYALNSEVA